MKRILMHVVDVNAEVFKLCSFYCKYYKENSNSSAARCSLFNLALKKEQSHDAFLRDKQCYNFEINLEDYK